MVVISVPETGSTIAGVENETDVSVFCEVMEGDMQELTSWTILKVNDEDGFPDLVMGDNPEYSTTGKPTGVGNITFGTNLTIQKLTADFDRAVLFCGTTGNSMAANFTLRIYRELSVCL